VSRIVVFHSAMRNMRNLSWKARLIGLTAGHRLPAKNFEITRRT
jgi:hypothetical protein